MEYRNSLRQLSDAIDLLAMLEQLSRGYENDKRTDVPWAGIKLTLAQARQLMESAYRDYYRDAELLEPVAMPAPSAPVASRPARAQSRGSSLADRVQPLPQLAGYVRDLLAPDAESRVAASNEMVSPEEFRFNERMIQNAE